MSKIKRGVITIAFSSALCIFGPAIAHDIPTPMVVQDDSETIAQRLKESMQSYGLISVEQGTGKLLFNPNIDKLASLPLKQKFLLPAMIINQQNGLKIVEELPFSCFMLSEAELFSEHYKGFKQYQTARYIRDVKNYEFSRVLLCQVVGLTGERSWSKNLDLNGNEHKFIFDQHKSLSGKDFYYFINAEGLFEMYF